MIEPQETVLGHLVEALHNGAVVRGVVTADRQEGVYVRFAGEKRAVLCTRAELSWPPPPDNVIPMYGPREMMPPRAPGTRRKENG
jgi:hypothetical protein